MPVRAPRPPRLPDGRRQHTWSAALDGADDREIEACDLTGDGIGVVAERCEVTGVTISGSRLTAAEFAGTRWRDVAVTGADLSGALFEEARWQRCSFVDCRMSGIVLAAAQLKEVTFVRCKLDQASLRMAVGEHVRFDDCDLTGADLYDASLLHAQFLGCHLVGVELSRARLTGAELHGSEIADVQGAAALRDVVIDPAQVVPVAMAMFVALGIDVTDLPTDVGASPPSDGAGVVIGGAHCVGE